MTEETLYQSNFLRFLAKRQLIQDVSAELDHALLASDGEVAYVGIDPTAGGIHVGNWATLMLLVHAARFGITPVVVIGDATALVGDPSGKSKERPLLSAEVIAENAQKIHQQVQTIFQKLAPTANLSVVHNTTWLAKMGFLGFLREVGVHFPVNIMLTKDSVRNRLETGISFTEFTYQIVQAYDFYHLQTTMGVSLQVGGADQWGNITAGIAYLRRKAGQVAHGLTTPLLTDAAGNKLGKTATGQTVWLAADQTSPYQFYQYWINQPDEVVPTLEARFLVDLPEDGVSIPDRKVALARTLTATLHGEAACAEVVAASAILFSSSAEVGPDAYELLRKEIPSCVLVRGEQGGAIFDQLAAAFSALPADQCISRSEIRRLAKQQGLEVNGVRITLDRLAEPLPAAHDKYYLVRRGKKRYVLIVLA